MDAYPDGYPPYVRGWFALAHAGSMQRGFRDVGYLLARRLESFRPEWLDAGGWQEHLATLRQHLERRDQWGAALWFGVTYPGLACLIPASKREQFIAGLREWVEQCVSR